MRSSFGIPAPRFDDSVLGTSHPALTGEMRLDRRYITEFRRATRVSTLLNATVVGLRLSPSGDAVTDAEVATLDGRRARVRAKAFVLAGGAIENARLLMMCPGLTDRLPALGRYFQDHPSEICARVEPTDRLELQDLFAVCHRRGRRYALRLRLADEAQRRAEVLACEGTLVWPVSPGLAALRRLAAGSRRPGAALSELPRAVRDGKEVLSAARRYRRGLNSAPAGVPLSLVLFCEQAPAPNCRLTPH